MNPLHEAFSVLGLQPGVSFDVVKTRYRRMAEVWHPDRAPTEEKREYATEELKKINHAYDVLKGHFDGPGHVSPGPCQCNATGDVNDSHRTNPGSGYHRQSTDAAPTQPPRQQQPLSSALLRWQLTMGLATAFMTVFVFACSAYALKGLVRHWFQTPAQAAPTHDSPQTPYTPEHTQTPRIDPSDIIRDQQMEQERKKREQDILAAKLEIDRHLKAIEHCRSAILDIEARLADPTIALSERVKLEQLSAFRQQILDTEQAALDSAQARLASLQQNSSPMEPSEKFQDHGCFAAPANPEMLAPRTQPSAYDQVAPTVQ